MQDTLTSIEIESFDLPNATNGQHFGLRPVHGEKFPSHLLLEGNKSLAVDYPVGTRFRVQAALRKRIDGSNYLFSSWQWDVKVLSRPHQARWAHTPD